MYNYETLERGENLKEMQRRRYGMPEMRKQKKFLGEEMKKGFSYWRKVTIMDSGGRLGDNRAGSAGR